MSVDSKRDINRGLGQQGGGIKHRLKQFSKNIGGSMGITKWFARRGQIGGTARAVAKGWEAINKGEPQMCPREIAEAYVNFRYGVTGEPHLAEKVLNTLPDDVNPLILSWTILKVENEDEIETVFNHMAEWKQIMSEEIAKYGIAPE